MIFFLIYGFLKFRLLFSKNISINNKKNNYKKNRRNKNEIKKSSITAIKLIKKNEEGLKKHNDYKENKIKRENMKVIFNINYLINNNDDDIDDINSVPYTQALRIDKRNLIQILFSVLVHKIGFLNLFFEENTYSHFSLDISIYLF